MLKEQSGPKAIYRCNDIGQRPSFDKLIFEVERPAE
jgi:hypothetical protein